MSVRDNTALFDKQIFIVGPGRSGTSLLQAVLNAHPLVCSPPEIHFFKYYICNPFRQHLNDIRHLEELRGFLERDAKIRRLGISPEDALQVFADRIRPFSLAEVYKRYMELYLRNFGKRSFADGSPANTLFLKAVHRHFPQAYIIHTLRDPRDVVLSMKKAAFNREENRSSVHLAYKVRQYHASVLANRGLFRERYCEVKYEQLVDHPGREIGKLCAFLHIDFDEKMLRFHQHSEQVFAEEESQWKSNLKQPFIAGNYMKWKKELSAEETDKIEWICARMMRAEGYAPSERHAGFSYLKNLKHIVDIIWYKIMNSRLLKKKDPRYND